MVDSLPSSNLGFDDLKTRMQAFTIRFDEFIEKGRKRVLEERNQFRVNVAENQGKCMERSSNASPLWTIAHNAQRTSV